MYHWHHVGVGIGWPGWLLMTLATVAFWGLLITAIVWLFRGPARGVTRPDPGGFATTGPRPDHPESILAQRFARGEIDEQEYRDRVAVLRGGADAGTPPGTQP